MGSKDSDGLADVDEQKEHSVNLNTFEISKFEVTVWEWKQFIKANIKNLRILEKYSHGKFIEGEIV